MYALIENEVVQKYPYSITDLRRANPGTSFPTNPSAATLAAWNVFDVLQVQRPEENYANNVYEGSPQKINGVWTQVWNTVPATDDETVERTQRQAEQVRAERNQRLAACDWTQLADSTADKTAWATYRQALRDITTQQGFPWEVTWPDQP